MNEQNQKPPSTPEQAEAGDLAKLQRYRAFVAQDAVCRPMVAHEKSDLGQYVLWSDVAAALSRERAAGELREVVLLASAAAHRACCGVEHDPLNGKLHGYCVVCGVPWPCETASRFIAASAPAAPSATRSCDLCGGPLDSTAVSDHVATVCGTCREATAAPGAPCPHCGKPAKWLGHKWYCENCRAELPSAKMPDAPGEAAQPQFASSYEAQEDRCSECLHSGMGESLEPPYTCPLRRGKPTCTGWRVRAAQPPAGPASAAGETPTFQSRAVEWALDCFGYDVVMNRVERGLRVCEEVMELSQCAGVSHAQARQVVDYVFKRPVEADPEKEVGGVVVTLAVLCEAMGVDMNRGAEWGLNYCIANTAKIRAKHNQKGASGVIVASVAPEGTATASGTETPTGLLGRLRFTASRPDGMSLCKLDPEDCRAVLLALDNVGTAPPGVATAIQSLKDSISQTVNDQSTLMLLAMRIGAVEDAVAAAAPPGVDLAKLRDFIAFATEWHEDDHGGDTFDKCHMSMCLRVKAIAASLVAAAAEGGESHGR